MASRLAQEAAEAADGARRQLETCAPVIADLQHHLAAHPPPFVVTCARGSSDHAATYGTYVIETTARTVVASVGPSVASMYRRGLARLDGALFIAVSQSGRSPDLVELTDAARRAGAFTVGLVNVEGSPLATACDVVMPLCAGEERGVAATKSFLLAGYAFLQLTAAWTGDAALREAVVRGPDALAEAAARPWDLSCLAPATSLYVLGRGIGLGPAQELALKLKETCRIHAEAFSTAEVLHGPVELVGPGFPVLGIVQPDETEGATADVLAKLSSLGASVITHAIPDVPAVLAPLCQVLSFYLGIPSLASARNLDADSPAHLSKVTKTM
jgi:glucosamine--fructose-6-phosphate aminotransferase (isomerizing)